MTDPDLEWLLCAAPALLGERSGHGALVAALESGTPGNGSASSSGAEDLFARARPHIARARRLGAVWRALAATHRALLTAHYEPRSHWAPGVRVALGQLAGAALAVAPSRAELERACSNALLPSHAAEIRRARARATRALNVAHAAWQAAKAADALAWVRGEPSGLDLPDSG